MIKIIFCIAKDNKLNLSGILITFITILILMTLVLSIRNYYHYYSEINYGFIPDIAVYFNNFDETDSLQKLTDEIKAEFNIKQIYQGVETLLKNVSFTINSNETVQKDVTVLGLIFNGDKKIYISQSNKKYCCNVINIGEFGNFYIDIQKNSNLNDGSCMLLLDDENSLSIPMIVLDYDNFIRLRYNGQSKEHDNLLYNYLIKYINRFANIKYSGINMNRFEYFQETDKLTNWFNVFYKKYILAYSGIIFEGNKNRVSSLITSDLMRSISKYFNIKSTIMKYSNEQIYLQVLDTFNFKPEKKINKSIILMNYSNFINHLKLIPKKFFIYIYCDESVNKNLLKKINDTDSKVNCILKSEIIPDLLIEQSIVNNSIKLLYLLFTSIVFFIIFIKLVKFYSIYEDDLILLKIYGFNLPIFFIMTMIVSIPGILISYTLLYYFNIFNNLLLTKYYYPPLDFNWSALVYSLITCFLILIIIYFIEIRMFHNISFSSGDNER